MLLVTTVEASQRAVVQRPASANGMVLPCSCAAGD